MEEGPFVFGQMTTWRFVHIHDLQGHIMLFCSCFLQWTARVVSWLFDSFPLLPTQELDHALTDRCVTDLRVRPQV